MQLNGVMMRSRFKRLLAQREAEENRSITLGEVAEATGININTLSRWSQPKVMSKVDSDVAYALCQYFGVTLNDLVEFVPPSSS